jgi:hypothetical protein
VHVVADQQVQCQQAGEHVRVPFRDRIACPVPPSRRDRGCGC